MSGQRKASKRYFSMWIEEEEKKLLQELAAKNGVSAGEMMNRILRKSLKLKKPKKGAK